MKKVFIILLIVIGSILLNVKGANYELKELIPVNVETTIVTDNFSYKNFYYNDNKMEAESLHNNFIIFSSIKNLTDKDLPVSISVALFDKDKKNIGLVNYCSSKDNTSIVSKTILQSKEEKSYVIEINKRYLDDKKSVNDIKYISVLSDNINCNTEGSLNYIGMTIDDIKQSKNNVLTEQTKLFIRVLTIAIFILLIYFIYNFVFTNKYQNIDGNDIRKGYKKYMKKKMKEKEEYLLNNPQEEEKIISKSKEIVKQEEDAKNKKTTDLHDLYK